MPETTVISIHKLTPAQIAEFVGGDPRYVYICKAMTLHGIKLKGSKWANPHDGRIDQICKTHKCGVREAVAISCEQYKADIRGNPKLLAALSELRGKTLICFWLEQGNALIELIETMES